MGVNAWSARLFASLALLTPHCAPAHHATDFDGLRDRIETIREDTAVPGASLVIVDREGIVWAAEFGVADVETRAPVTPDTVFRIGSVTKIFTAAALVQLDRREDFSLDDAVSDYVPPGMFFNRWEEERPLTVAQLLEHTSGFRDWTKAEFDYNEEVGLEEGLAYSPRARTSYWEPGLHSVYSNANYGLAGLVLERVSGQDYEDALQQRLFAPLEMRSATSLQGRTIGLATGYDRDGLTPIPYWHMIQRPAAAINMRPREMAALVSMLLNEGKYKQQTVLTPDELARMETPRTSLAARNGLRFGYGLGMYAKYHNGFLFMGHGGDGDGYLSRFGYCRELGVGYFVTFNSANQRALGRFSRTIESALTREHQAPAPPQRAETGTEQLDAYTGRYALAAWRFYWQSGTTRTRRTLTVRLSQDGRLFTLETGGRDTELIAVTAQTFRRIGESDATSGFFRENGRLYFQEEDNWVRIDDAER